MSHTPLDGLRQVDTLLAFIAPNYRRTLHAMTEALPGISGRPAGNGEMGVGSGATTTTIVERTHASTSWRRVQSEVARFEALPGLCVGACDELSGAMGVRALEMPDRHTAAMQWTWAAYVTRLCIGLAEQRRVKVPDGQATDLHRIVSQTATTIEDWTGRRVPAVSEVGELAVDLTEIWCRRHLRYGQREPRDSRYPVGLCRWCGDFKAHNGWWPTEALLDARRDGHKITEALIKAERPKKKK